MPRRPIRIVSPDRRHVLWQTNKPLLPLFHQQTSAPAPAPQQMPADSGDETSDSGRSTPANEELPPRGRQVVDFELDDGDSDWEDDLPGGTSTHRSRNPARTVIPIRKRQRASGGANARATALKRRAEKSSKMQRLADDLDALDAEREERALLLAAKHGIKIKEVRRRMLSSSVFKKRRKVSLYNAKISAIMARLNESTSYLGTWFIFTSCLLSSIERVTGERYTIPDVKALVAEDPSLLEGFTKEEEKTMVAAVLAKRGLKRRGMRANNIAAGADAKRTVVRLMEEVRRRFLSHRSWLTSPSDHRPRRARGYDRLRHVHPWPHPRHHHPSYHPVVGGAGFFLRGAQEGSRGCQRVV